MFEYAGICMRGIEEADLKRMADLRNDPKIWTYLGDITMVTLWSQQRWLEAVRNDPKRRYYVLSSSEVEFLGIVRIDEIDWINRSARVGGDIVSSLHGRGYGTRMFRLIVKYCFDYLNLNRLWLLVLETNHVAQKLYRNAGFVEEGRQRQAIYRDGSYHDYVMMSLLRSDPRSDE